ncbi:MAG TPA: asparagine synthase (glutamine-hydrolyzing) [Cyclobacteriaceae bacterium]|nr:asparagine synthase (glutamine-hydrolyzing) [Cyclobacteriaceae bacterium]
MCRIAGRVSRQGNPEFADGLKRMMDAMAHGGPDDEGTYFYEGVALGHRRLSIIDLTQGGHQPMQTSDGRYVISYNGEIYNYLILKKELEAKGVTFVSNSDTEVILRGFEYWGAPLFDRLEGIFAFALFDRNDERFYLVRDHLGVKPLYFYLNDSELVFSSEVRGFKALKSDWPEYEDWRVMFLAFGSIPHPYTTLSGVLQLAPGTYLELGVKDFSHRHVTYYHPNNKDYERDNIRDTLVAMQFTSRKAVRKNLIADAPLGIFLSGGIDSSLLTLLADQYSNNVRTISVNFDEASYDEYPFQKMVLERTQNVVHITHRVTEHMFWEQLPDIWNAMDQPSIDGVNTYFVTRCAKDDGIKAVLSGVGADEIFGGYHSFERIKWMRWFKRLPAKRIWAKLAARIRKSWGRVIYLTFPGPVGDYLFLRGIFTPAEIGALLHMPVRRVWEVLRQIPVEIPHAMSDVAYASYLESKYYLVNQLLKDTDVMGMWNGVEVRAPYLDIEMVKKVHGIPPALRYRKLWPKHLITASNQNILPHEIIFRKKKGFTFPFDYWMRHGGKRFRQLLPQGKEIDHVEQEFRQGRCHWSKYWSLAVLNRFNPSIEKQQNNY